MSDERQNISELRRRALALAKVKRDAEQGPYLELIAELIRQIERNRQDIQDLQINMGALRNQLTGLVGQETAELLTPVLLRLDAIAARLGVLEARELGGEG